VNTAEENAGESSRIVWFANAFGWFRREPWVVGGVIVMIWWRPRETSADRAPGSLAASSSRDPHARGGEPPPVRDDVRRANS